jgi:hypothetical protein
MQRWESVAVHSAALQLGLQGLVSSLARVLRAHRWLLAAVLVYFAAGLAAVAYIDRPERMTFSLYSALAVRATGFYLLGFALAYPVYVMAVTRPARLVDHLITDLKTNWLTAERLMGGFLILVLLPRVISVFTSFKTLIPIVNPYSWDPAFAEWDRVLHGGVHPWEWLQPLFGFPWVTSGINFFYNLWIFVLYGILVWQAFSLRDPRLRMQFFLTFVLVWSLLGNLAATLLASAGPVYFGRITGLEDPFAPLVDYLYAANEVAPVWSLEIHEWLWRSHILGDYDFGTGISAMPSIHVAAATLFALLGWRVHRVVGVVLTVFAALILLGSVHLAWHYAIDGYLSIVLTYLLWRAAGWWVARDKALVPA